MKFISFRQPETDTDQEAKTQLQIIISWRNAIVPITQPNDKKTHKDMSGSDRNFKTNGLWSIEASVM